MLELKRGQIGKLTGRGISYARLEGESKDILPYPALAFGREPLEAAELIFKKPDMEPQAWQKLKEESREVWKKMEKGLCMVPCEFKDEGEILRIGDAHDADILYCGPVRAEGLPDLLYSSVAFYKARYLSQVPIGTSDGVTADRTELYLGYDSKNLRGHLVGLAYMSLRAESANDAGTRDRHLSEIRDLLKGTNLEAQGKELVEVLKGSHPEKFSIANAIIDKIIAAREERFEDAKYLKDLIEKLKGSQQASS